jgi:formiminotetrahydrofolate cyclodeaminase
MYIEKPLKEYLEDLAAKKPAPGGGSAAALAGALGVALLEMSANFTVGKEKYKEYEQDASEALRMSGILRNSLTHLVDSDVEAYSKLSEAFKMKNDSHLDAALKEATRIPVTIAQDSLEGLRQAVKLAGACNPNLISDVGVAGELLSSAYEGAKYNIKINLKLIRDEEFVGMIRTHLKTMNREVAALRRKIARKVRSIMEAGR